MFGNAFGWPHLLIILAIILLIFGAPKLPQLARSISQSMRIFRSEIKTDKKDDVDGADPAGFASSQPTASDLAAQQAAADAAARQVAEQQAAARQAAAQQSADRPKP
jgi:sec-independent protein translocase protein TatA